MFSVRYFFVGMLEASCLTSILRFALPILTQVWTEDIERKTYREFLSRLFKRVSTKRPDNTVGFRTLKTILNLKAKVPLSKNDDDTDFSDNESDANASEEFEEEPQSPRTPQMVVRRSSMREIAKAKPAVVDNEPEPEKVGQTVIEQRGRDGAPGGADGIGMVNTAAMSDQTAKDGISKEVPQAKPDATLRGANPQPDESSDDTSIPLAWRRRGGEAASGGRSAPPKKESLIALSKWPTRNAVREDETDLEVENQVDDYDDDNNDGYVLSKADAEYAISHDENVIIAEYKAQVKHDDQETQRKMQLLVTETNAMQHTLTNPGLAGPARTQLVAANAKVRRCRSCIMSPANVLMTQFPLLCRRSLNWDVLKLSVNG